MSRQARVTTRPFKSLAHGLAGRTAVGMCLFVCAMGARATTVDYLEIPGIAGPVDAPGFNGAFLVDSYSFGLSSTGHGHPPVETLDVVMPVSAGFPALALAAGDALPLVFLDGFIDTSSTTPEFEVTLENALIAGLSLSTRGGVVEEQVDFDFARSTTTTCSADGGSCPSTPSVPEPAALALLGLGLAGVGLMKRRKAA